MNRTLAREVAMKILFARSLGGEDTWEEVLEQSQARDELSDEDKTFLENEVFGVERHREELDGLIDGYAKGWNLNRLAKVDLTLLRMGLFELLYLPEVPVGAAINEAVELSKRYGEDKSYSFINGILGTAARELRK
ncbi:MAG: transcription antitermination factor NusB [Eubacteriales bacterium]|jgi:N utilization substance protein B|nr:transcription antitermination factor NusB [Clostridiales bacterium]MDD7396413.1 transcription antitermination factor NusB [Eubacteriales bacterium]MDY2982518.1 transcription antitermination factor NusB [Eubacteriales bacterium]